MNRRTLPFALTFLFLLSCAGRQAGDPLKPGYNVFSREQDVQLGQEAAGEISKQVDIVDNPRLQQYIRQLGARLAEQPQAENYPYKFTLINEPSINAFALPGGPIFVHSGLISAADNEGQLVGVLAHEISHVALRHGTSQASKAQMVQLPAVLAGAILGNGGALSQIGQVGVGLGLNALITKYSRSAEKQADALGARIMAQSGFDPIHMARFFEKLAEQGGPRPPTFLSTHPAPGNRTRLVQEEMATLPQAQYGYQTGEFGDAKRMVAQLPEPKRPPQQEQQQQQLANSSSRPPSSPGSGFQRLQARTFSMEYPQGWQAYGGASGASITIAPRQGLVQGSNGVSIGYGAVISRYEPRYRTDLLNATWELVQQLQEMDPGTRVSGGPRQAQVSGSQALVVQLSGRSPYGGAERDVLLTVARPDGMFYMLLVAPERGFEQLQPAFERMLSSIRFH